MGYLFLVNLGPIQSFIASGRRSRDLWFGSGLLSELSKTAARTITERAGDYDLIFPALDKEELKKGSELAVPNKIIAYVQGNPQELGLAVRESVLEHLRDLKKEVYKELEMAAEKNKLAGRQIEDLIDKPMADKQIEELIECVWVAVEYDRERERYVDKRDKLERWLEARKNTRDFAPVTVWSDQPKSSINGQLESVLRTSFYPSREERAQGKQENGAGKKASDPLTRYAIFRAGPSEHLSGVDLLKRRGKLKRGDELQDRFLSTSHVAAIPYLQRLNRLEDGKRKGAKAAWERYIETIRRTITDTNRRPDPDEALVSVLEKIPDGYYTSSILEQYDGALLFGERLREDFPDATDFGEISKALESFFAEVDTPLMQPRPHPYYAILRADGDGMGKLIDRQARAGNGFAGHREVSEKLTDFAAKVKKVVEEKHKGTLLYAGGDDVLAFLPLHTVLSCARELAQIFMKTLKFEDEQPTLSVGIAIVHHLSLLRDALEQSQQVEKRAKAVQGKGALAITLYRRSGEEYSIRGKLGELEGYLSWLTPYFMSDSPAEASGLRIEDQQRQEEKSEERGVGDGLQRLSLPRGMAYELRDTSLRLIPFSPHEVGKDERENLQEALHAAMLRILQRKLNASTRKMTPNVKDAIRLLLSVFKKRMGAPLDEKDTQRLSEAGEIEAVLEDLSAVDSAEFINEFIIAHELADALALTGQTRAETHKRRQDRAVIEKESVQ